MDLLDKLKLLRDDLNLMIEAEEKKRSYQSMVGKDFTQRVKERMEMKDDGWRSAPTTLVKFCDVTKEIEKIL